MSGHLHEFALHSFCERARSERGSYSTGAYARQSVQDVGGGRRNCAEYVANKSICSSFAAPAGGATRGVYPAITDLLAKSHHRSAHADEIGNMNGEDRLQACFVCGSKMESAKSASPAMLVVNVWSLLIEYFAKPREAFMCVSSP